MCFPLLFPLVGLFVELLKRCFHSYASVPLRRVVVSVAFPPQPLPPSYKEMIRGAGPGFG